MISKGTILSGLLALGVLNGCATVQPGAGFDDVEAVVTERTAYQVRWDQATPADRAVADTLRAMLSDTLQVGEAVQIALLNNRSLQATYEELTIAQADLVRAGLLSNPIFDAEARFSGEGTGLELSVVQPFIDIFYIPLRTRIAEQAFEAAKLEVAGAVIDLAARTQRTFYEMQAARQLVELRQTVLSAFEASYAVAQQLHEAGNVTDLRLTLERTQYEEARVNLAETQADVLLLREELNALMGLWGPTAARWTIVRRLPGLPPNEMELDSLEARAVANSLGLGVLRRQIVQAGERLGLARPEALIPDADVGGLAEREPNGEWTGGAILGFPLPIFNWGQAAVPEARARLRQVQDRYAARAVEVRAAVRAAGTRVAAAHDRAAYYREVLLPLRERVVALTQLQYNAMQTGVFELLQTRRQLVEAGVEYIQVLQDYWLGRMQLEQILNGRLGGIESVSEMNESAEVSPSEDEGGH